VNLHPVSEVRSKDVPLVKGPKEWSTTMPTRNLKEFLSQTESMAEVNWRERNKAITEKAKYQRLGLEFMVGQDRLIKNTCSSRDLKKAFLVVVGDKQPDHRH
jgi:hypothetical protein